ncbi:MAG: HAMP domain-containing histidine kinase, partial [Sulfuricurvum sp.]|nr:HAMP domain-containing histidine kinase [Sulfuricurvum sp.]
MKLDEVHKMVSVLRGSALCAFNLLENLLEWSRIKRGIISFNPESFILSSKVDDFLQPVLASANKKLIEINYSVPDDLVVFADQNMMGSIIRNLTSNAVKFTPKNGKVFLSAQVNGDQNIEISVKDSGIGMNKSILNKLFNIDRNNNRKGTEGEPSSGLGLIICQEFVEKHGGRIWVESLEGKGSTFYLTLPQKKSDE